MMRVVAADGTALAVESEGAGTPVVFVHGSNGGLDSWADIGARITGHRVVRYARRNYAPSATGPSPNGFAVEAADLAAVLAEVGEPAHVLGGSYGATVALHAAAHDASGIASLSLFEPPLLLSGPHLGEVLPRYEELCAAERFAEALTLFLREVAQVPDEVMAGADVPDDREAALGALGDLQAMAADTADVERWQAVDVPVLLMGGGLSWPPLRDGMDRLADVLPHAHRVVWPDQSHFATALVPDRLADEIQRFVDRVSSRR